MRINTKVLFIVAIAAIFFSSCGDDVTLMSPPFDTGSNYQPLEEGRFWTYRVDSTTVTTGGAMVSQSTSFLRETLISSFLGANGDTTFVIERSFANQQEGPFFSTDRWTIEKSDENLIRVEENLPFIKMVFPVREGSTWAGNQFDESIQIPVAQQLVTIYRDWEYRVLATDATTEVDGVTYEDVLEIQQAEFETALELRRSKEQYVRDIGLVRREMEIYDTQCIDPACQQQPWLDKAEAGFRLVQTLVDFN